MKDANEINTAAQIIERLAKQGVEVKSQEVLFNRNARAFAFVPDGVKVEPLDFLNAKKPTADITFIDAESFVSYLKDYANANESRMFASLGATGIHCAIDYAPKCNLPSKAIGGAGEHNARFCLCETEDFKAWKEINETPLSQAEFIQFLLERAHCFENPDQATILEIATKLEVKNNVTFSGKERSSDGGINLTYRAAAAARAGLRASPASRGTEVVILGFARIRAMSSMAWWLPPSSPTDTPAWEQQIFTLNLG